MHLRHDFGKSSNFRKNFFPIYVKTGPMNCHEFTDRPISITLINLLDCFQKLCKLIWAWGTLRTACDTLKPLLHIRNLLSFAKGGDSFEVAAASTVEVHLGNHISEELEFDRLTAHSFRLCHDGSYTAVECIVYNSHFRQLYTDKDSQNLTMM